MEDGFFLADEKHKTITGETVELKGLLYFRQARSGFDGKATKEHVKNYPTLFGEFVTKHPDFVLPSSFAPEEIGDPSAVTVAPEVVSAPVVEAPVVEAPVVDAEPEVAEEVKSKKSK